MYGFTGKILHVNLNAGRLWDEPLSVDFARDFVGGSGYAARLIYDLVDDRTDPFGPENPLVFMTGPLVGASFPSSGRYSVCSISPLTGIWGESNSGGFFGPELRFAGYDGIMITGQADKPAWLSIVEGRAELHDAADLWGCDTYATQERVRRSMGEAKARVACIGPAGENQVRMAAIVNDRGRAAGRTGMGAVMGAKNLKAIAVRGSSKVRLADPEGFKEVVKAVLAEQKEDVAVEALRLAGTAGYVSMGVMYGDLPIRYYQQGEWDEADKLSGVVMATSYQNRNTACYGCSIACGRETRASSYGAGTVDGPEYESIGALGTTCLVSDLEAVIYANHLCNLYGMDTISAGCTIALACEMFERGLLTSEDTGGLEARFGDAQGMISLLEMMANRKGFGDVMAEGSSALAERYNVPELATTVNRLEVPMHDPRAFSGMAVSYALSPRGACHMEGDMYSVDTGQASPDELGVTPGDRFEDSEEKGRISARQQAWRNLYNALTICQFQNPGVNSLLSALNCATGWDLQAEDLMETGKRILNLKRLLNGRRGLTRSNDRLPDLLLKPLAAGGTEGYVPDMVPLLAGAYDELGWDRDSGMPTPDTLARLGL